MRVTSLLRTILAMKQTRVVGATFGPYGLEIEVAPTTRLPRCSGCGCVRRRVYDRRSRLWRHLDFGGMEVTLRYDLRRVDCRRCGKVAEMVPWAEHDSRYTRDFEEHVAYLAQRTDQTSVSTSMRIAWRTVGTIVERVVGRCHRSDLLDDLEYIGIDELSYRRHHEYLTVVVDHVQQRVVWVSEGKNVATVGRFFDALGAGRTARLKCVTVDMSAAYVEAVTSRAPQAQIVFDRFHVQRLVQDALDEVRRAEVRALEGPERHGLKKTRWALLKNYWDLSAAEHERLSTVQRTNRRLYRAYLLKAALADILGRRQVGIVRQKLTEWISWALRSRLKPFKKAAKTLRKYFEGVVAIVATGLNNARAEGLNGKIRTITRRAYGFHHAPSLMAFIMLCCTGLVLLPVFKTPLHP